MTLLSLTLVGCLAGGDAVLSSPSDSGALDTGAIGEPLACPSGSFDGSGSATLHTPEGTTLCVLGSAVVADLDTLRRVTFACGDFPLPLEAGSHDYRLPLCVEGP